MIPISKIYKNMQQNGKRFLQSQSKNSKLNLMKREINGQSRQKHMLLIPILGFQKNTKT